MLSRTCLFSNDFWSLVRYSKQEIASWHGNLLENAAQHPADSLLKSCLSSFQRSAVSRAAESAAYERGAKRSPARAGPGALDAKTHLETHTKTGKSLGSASDASASWLPQHGEERCKWASDNLAAADSKI